jgi:hypothetical protein
MRVGVPHRVLRTLTLFTFRWDELSCSTGLLHPGAIFVPWEPSPWARGDRVPVTLGEGATGHGWGPEARDGHFLLDEELECLCAPLDAPPPPRGEPMRTRSGPRPTAFAELPTLLGLLRARASTVTDGAVGDVGAALEAMARVHDWAMRMELGASSFDNVGAMRHAADIAADVLGQARALWATARQITRT